MMGCGVHWGFTGDQEGREVSLCCSLPSLLCCSVVLDKVSAFLLLEAAGCGQCLETVPCVTVSEGCDKDWGPPTASCMGTW